MKLTVKQRAFVEAYTSNGGNATAAARAAGYRGSDATLRQVASENLAKPDVQDAIAAATAEVRSEAIATRRRRQEFWTSVMEGEETETRVDADGGVHEVCPLSARLKASELLGRSQGDFLDRVKHETGFEKLSDEELAARLEAAAVATRGAA